MKSLKNYSVQELNRLSKIKEIYCYGCGKVFHDLLEMYENEPFVERITKIVDGNHKLWGSVIKIRNREIEIVAPSILQHVEKKAIVLITTKNPDEIYDNICRIDVSEKLVCSKYPYIYYEFAKILLKVFSYFPNRYCLLFSYGNDTHENAIAVIEYLNENELLQKYKIVLLTDSNHMHQMFADKHICIEKDVISGRKNIKKILRYCYYYGRAKYLFYENQKIGKVGKSQKLIFLNHGTVPLKKVKDVMKQPRELDYAVCPSENCAKIYQEQYGIPVEKQIYFMHPRVSLLLKGNPKVKDYLKFDGQIILWLPTFRIHKDGNRVDANRADVPFGIFKKGMQAVNQFLKEHNQLLIIKKHPCEKNDIIVENKYENIRIITDEELRKESIVLQELLHVTDALITDYSGVTFEYLFLNKPIGYVIKDIEQYHRGFAFDNPLDYMPGKKINTEDELICFFEEIYHREDVYHVQREDLRRRLFGEINPYTGVEELIKFIKQEN